MRNIASLIVAASALVWAGAANAASETFFSNHPSPQGNNFGCAPCSGSPINLDETDWDGSTPTDPSGQVPELTFPKFDVAHATLTSITISIYSDTTSSVTVTNTGSLTSTIIHYTTTLDVAALKPGSSVPTSFDSSTPDHLVEVSPVLATIMDGTMLARHGSLNFSQTAPSNGTTASSVLTSGFGDYEGVGNVLLPLVANVTTDEEYTDGNLSTDQSITARVLGAITYTYTITTTPEPMSLSLLGAGLIGLALVRRRRSSV